MTTVNFYETVEDTLLKYAVIVSRHKNKWVFCKHRERDTYECPGGTREPGEDIEKTAHRELWEETGAKDYTLQKICVYAVDRDGDIRTGMLYYADIKEFGELPPSEIEKTELFDNMPESWTYPLIQPHLVAKVCEVLGI